jgi:hypothetical protein
MNFSIIGPAAAAATFLGIWFGHVLVRQLEFRSASIALPAACFAGLGIFFGAASLLVDSLALSAVFGILSVTALWDSYEFSRQQKRVVKGHAPANPNNPRHRRIPAAHPSATAVDLLNRDPVGRQVRGDEAARLAASREKSR